jgi:MFS family permease
MTATTTAPSDGTHTLRVAGILFVIAGIATPVSAGVLQLSLSMKAPPDIYVYGPGILVALAAGLAGLVAGIAYLVAFVLLFAWSPGRGRQLLFFAPALGGVIGVASWAIDDTGVLIVGVLLSLLAIVSGVYVFQQRIFLAPGSLIFLLTMILAQSPAVGELYDPSNQWLSLLLRSGGGVCYVVCGFAMMDAARKRSRLNHEGLLAR